MPHFEQSPVGQLALVILLDQFRRNVFRGTAAAFAEDERALAIAERAIARGDDEQLHPIERVFLYMPFQHAESVPVQQRSLQLFESLAASVTPRQRPLFDNYARYARLHHDIVARFGRFPHRNAILGRPSTPEEQAYLDGDAPRFGQ